MTLYGCGLNKVTQRCRISRDPPDGWASKAKDGLEWILDTDSASRVVE